MRLVSIYQSPFRGVEQMLSSPLHSSCALGGCADNPCRDRHNILQDPLRCTLLLAGSSK